ncbi:putative proteasome subunit alpha type-1 [Erysiphe pulchra]|uniref:Proteasome subunit alpha type n=1 Tax=Erysiphe pulchra TaxID=225359 RepID=A0A2S4Q0S3_9PEZI|nr:putative proteasome subunit alpha type-1 [Erysiphe pulchra]
MFRNNYDNDSVTFSPQGRIFQVEYASEAVKQGSVVVGIVSKTHAVLVVLKRNAEELSSYQKKIIAVDEHLGLALAGLASDARVLSNIMRTQCSTSRLTFDRAIPLSRIVSSIGSRAQSNTQNYGRRPYGVGLLIAGVDESGPHLFEFQPSGMTQEMLACAIGARSQMARTYLERNVESFADCNREDLIKHGLQALKESLTQDKELAIENTSVGVVGMGSGSKIEVFKLYDGIEVKQWIDLVSDKPNITEAVETMEIDS